MKLIGAIAGDIIGSIYEWNNAKSLHDINFFAKGCHFTDDTVLTCAVANWLIENSECCYDKEDLFSHDILIKNLKTFAEAFPQAGYGRMFRSWFQGEKQEPMNSFGNGAGMRVSPVAFDCEKLDSVKKWAKASAEVTHNHPEGVKGAQAIACAIWLAGHQYSKKEIKEYIEKEFGYDLNKSLEEMGRNVHGFDATCQVTVPEAITAFLMGQNYIDVINKALLIGGDSDTIACMAGAIAGAYYGVPEWIEREVMARLPEKLAETVVKFEEYVNRGRYCNTDCER